MFVVCCCIRKFFIEEVNLAKVLIYSYALVTLLIVFESPYLREV